jgi:hypothetical protein
VLAHCYHLVDFGWTETIFNHISARLPGTDHYLVNPFGLNYDEVTPANLLKVDIDGHKIEPSPYDANPAGFCAARRHPRCPRGHPLPDPHPHHADLGHRDEAGRFQPRRFYGAQPLRPRGLPH